MLIQFVFFLTYACTVYTNMQKSVQTVFDVYTVPVHDTVIILEHRNIVETG